MDKDIKVKDEQGVLENTEGAMETTTIENGSDVVQGRERSEKPLAKKLKRSPSLLIRVDFQWSSPWLK